MRMSFLSALVLVFFALSAPATHAASPVPHYPLLLAANSAADSDKVDLNSADAHRLKSELSGIGLAKAEAIVKHRQAYGPFHSVDELLEVKGIGKALLDRNRAKLVVK